MAADEQREAQAEAEVNVRDAARAGDYDRYLAALLAPKAKRGALVTLAAFAAETARIACAVVEPMMGEMRLQWWRDAIAAPATKTGNPVADALDRLVARGTIASDALVATLDARASELQSGTLAEPATLEAYLDAIDGAMFRMAAGILGVPVNSAAERALFAAGQAWGRVRVLRALPAWRAGGRNPLAPEAGADAVADGLEERVRKECAAARAWLAQARTEAAAPPRALVTAILPLALVEPYLAALERLGSRVTRERADISPLNKVWRLWRASVLGRI